MSQIRLPYRVGVSSTLELSTFTHESNQTSYRVGVSSTLELSTFTHESNQTSYRVGVTGRQAGREGGKEGCETWHLISRGYNYMVLCTLTSSHIRPKNSNVGAQQIIKRPIKYHPHYYCPTRNSPPD
jgi:hypothetical protein